MCEQVSEFHVTDEERGSKKPVGSCVAPHKPREYVEEAWKDLVTLKAHTKTV